MCILVPAAKEIEIRFSVSGICRANFINWDFELEGVGLGLSDNICLLNLDFDPPPRPQIGLASRGANWSAQLSPWGHNWIGKLKLSLSHNNMCGSFKTLSPSSLGQQANAAVPWGKSWILELKLSQYYVVGVITYRFWGLSSKWVRIAAEQWLLAKQPSLGQQSNFRVLMMRELSLVVGVDLKWNWKVSLIYSQGRGLKSKRPELW